MTNNLHNSKNQSSNKVYDLEERTFLFARDCALYCKKLPRTVSNTNYSNQLTRSSGSTGANYIEANEALSKKDFLMRIKISRKEAKESTFWLRLIIETNEESFKQEGLKLFNEAIELKKIFSAILLK